MTKIKKVIKEIRDGNINAMAELYHQHKDALFLSCLKYSKNTEDAEDVLQDSFVIIFQTCHKFKAKGTFEGWMKRIVINTAIQKYKHERRFEVEYNDNMIKEISVDQKLIEQIPLKQILELVQQLPHQYRMVFSLYELDGCSHKEVANLLEISESTSKSNLFRAKKILQSKLISYTPTRNKQLSNGE